MQKLHEHKEEVNGIQMKNEKKKNRRRKRMLLLDSDRMMIRRKRRYVRKSRKKTVVSQEDQSLFTNQRTNPVFIDVDYKSERSHPPKNN